MRAKDAIKSVLNSTQSMLDWYLADLSDEVATRLGEEITKVLESFHVEEADSLVG